MADETEDQVKKTQAYTLKKGMEHSFVKDGEVVTLTGGEGDEDVTVELTPVQYEMFKDKFEAPKSTAQTETKTDEQPKTPATPAKPAAK
ncbi:hypothetical protein [Parvimonas sp. M20]|uniref:hypothetical protein n=1 Tax=Parvimonas sp. M20 TaxID=3110693 RepID=UPI002B47A727|nr:hypothetical protein [Parvimonas sp. M20]MEB3089965.1 hypothetical protein [Parvimonas sp. M20]